MFKDVGDINVDLHYGENNSPPPHYNPQLSQIGVQQIDNIKFLEQAILKGPLFKDNLKTWFTKSFQGSPSPHLSFQYAFS